MAESAGSQNLPSSSKQSSRDKIYLETHTWHAEYFHMIDKWRHRIPYYSVEENFTAYIKKSLTSLKALTENCLLKDISYYTCIEIVGKKNWLEAALREHCAPKKTFADKRYTNGQTEGTVMFFKKKGYPEFPIGYVNFFWKPSKTDNKTIWIWVHPVFYSDFLSEIISSFEFKQNNAEQDKTDISHNLNDLYTNDEGCQMRVLKDALNRFRLSGPTALTVLTEALHVPSLTELDLESKNCPNTEEQSSSLNDEELDSSLIDEKLDPTSSGYYIFDKPLLQTGIKEKTNKNLTIEDRGTKMWHTIYYRRRGNIEVYKTQEKMWHLMKGLRSPRFLLPNIIIGLTVLDPRFYLHPNRREKTKIYSNAEKLRCESSTNLSRSPIWDAKIRQIVSSSCMSSETLEEIELEKIVVSPDLYFSKDSVAKIPIFLIQKPAVRTASLGFGSSIDIIIPSRWAVVFWMALVKQSGLVGGLRETELVVFEGLGTYVPEYNDPDTPAYMREALTRKEELTDEYFSHSPISKIIFVEFGIRSPFFCDWKNLTKGWSDVEDFYVLRNFGLLSLLRTEIKTFECKNTKSKSVIEVSKFDKYKNCLVKVQLSMMGKGTPEEFAIICMPTLEDLERFEDNKEYAGPLEKCHVDPNEKSRRKLRKEYLMHLKRLSPRTVDWKKTFRSKVAKPKKSDVRNRAERSKKLDEIKSDYVKEMKKLCLSESKEVRHSCDREVMGYVTMGGYSFLRAKAIGIGYITLLSLLEIIRKRFRISGPFSPTPSAC